MTLIIAHRGSSGYKPEMTIPAYELALKYSHERKAFGKEIFNHQVIAFKLADMYVKVTAAKLLVMKAACEKDEGKDIAQQREKLLELKSGEEKNKEAREAQMLGYAIQADTAKKNKILQMQQIAATREANIDSIVVDN